MNKFFFLPLAAFAALSLAACVGIDNPDEPSGKEEHGVDGITPMPKAVDIGLKVDGKTVLIASCNLGASKEYEQGSFFAWGETAPKDEYTWGNYAFCSGSDRKLTAYCPKIKSHFWDDGAKPDGPDDIVELSPAHDAAHVLLGGQWRMPTADELKAILALKGDTVNYDWDKYAIAYDESGKEVKDSRGNVIRGLRITHKATNTSVFLPVRRYIGAGVANYWSSSLYSEKTIMADAYLMTPNYACTFFLEGGDDYWKLYSEARCAGNPIRPVCVKVTQD